MSKCVGAMPGERQVRGEVGKGAGMAAGMAGMAAVGEGNVLGWGRALRRLMQQGVT